MPDETPKKWSASTHEENWCSYETFDTREEAIASAPGVLGLEEGKRFWTGHQVPVDPADIVSAAFDGSSLSDQLASALYDVIGDHVELESTKQQDDELEAAVQEAALAWLKKYMPECYTVADVKDHISSHCGDCDQSRDCYNAKGSPSCCADEIPDGGPMI